MKLDILFDLERGKRGLFIIDDEERATFLCILSEDKDIRQRQEDAIEQVNDVLNPSDDNNMDKLVMKCEKEPIKFCWSKNNKNFIFYVVHEKDIPAGVKYRCIWMDNDPRFTSEEAHGITGHKK